MRLVRGLINDILKPPDGTLVTGFKEIRYLKDEIYDYLYWPLIRFLLFEIGEGQIVLLTRDPEEVAKSGWFRDIDRDTILPRIRASQERFRETAQAFPKRTFLIDHSDFDGNPEGLRPLLTWLGEKMEVATLDAVLRERLTHGN